MKRDYMFFALFFIVGCQSTDNSSVISDRREPFHAITLEEELSRADKRLSSETSEFLIETYFLNEEVIIVRRNHLLPDSDPNYLVLEDRFNMNDRLNDFLSLNRDNVDFSMVVEMVNVLNLLNRTKDASFICKDYYDNFSDSPGTIRLCGLMFFYAEDICESIRYYEMVGEPNDFETIKSMKVIWSHMNGGSTLVCNN